MTLVGQPKCATQARVLRRFHEELGYTYLGDYGERDGNGGIEEGRRSAGRRS